MNITEKLIEKLRDNYNNYGIHAILPQNLDKSIMIQYIKTYQKFDQGNANLLEVTFLTLFALWFTKNDEIEAEKVDLHIYYTYRYYHECLSFK